MTDSDFLIKFTAPGDDLDEGTGLTQIMQLFSVCLSLILMSDTFFPATLYDLRYANDLDLLRNDSWWNGDFNVTDNIIAGKVLNESLSSGSLDPLEAGELVNISIARSDLPLDAQFVFAMRAFDENDLSSPTSNWARVFNTYIDEGDSGLSGGAIAGIVIGVLLAICIIAVVGYLIVKKMKQDV